MKIARSILLLQYMSIHLFCVTASLSGRSHRDEFASCDGCFCVPDEGDTCPNDLRPETDWASLIPKLRAFHLSNPPTLTCDPYKDDLCTISPPAEDGEGVCVVEITPSTSACPEDWSYELQTYPLTVQEAEADGLYVTHSSPCGVCSSLQDLAVYMEQGSQLRNAAQRCGAQGLFGYRAGTRCFRNLGFTDACAAMWYYNTVKTQKECGSLCWPFFLFNKDPNGAPPQCELASCIECDEVVSGPKFDLFAGRTRRNSGLLSNIVRPCSEMEMLTQSDPCDV